MSYFVYGVTRDATGTALGNCTVEVYETVSNLWRGSTISDANGNYKIEVAGDRTLTLQVIATDSSGNLAGASVSTLLAS